MPAVEERRGQPDKGVTLQISPEVLTACNLPAPVLYRERTLITEVDGHQVAIGLYALPPRGSKLSEFWKRFKKRLGKEEDAELPPARMRLHEPVPASQFKRGQHTNLSREFPYAVLGNGTRYGILVVIPSALIGEWSETQERASEGEYIFGQREVFRQRQGISILIRVNGDTPLTQVVVPGEGRQEMWSGVPDPQGDREDVVFLVSERDVIELGSKRSREGEHSGNTDDLVFREIAEVGTAENAEFGNQGLVQVVVARTLQDQVLEIIEPSKGTFLITNKDISPPESLDMGLLPKRSLDTNLPDATVRGETMFENRRRTKIKTGKTVLAAEPIADFNFALVGDGGPIPMEEADFST